MHCFYSAGICELLGMYILNILDKKYRKERVDLYKDDSFACLKYIRVPQADNNRKDNSKSLNQNWTPIILVKQTSKLSVF